MKSLSSPMPSAALRSRRTKLLFAASSRRAPGSSARRSSIANFSATGHARRRCPASWTFSRAGTASIPRRISRNSPHAVGEATCSARRWRTRAIASPDAPRATLSFRVRCLGGRRQRRNQLALAQGFGCKEHRQRRETQARHRHVPDRIAVVRDDARSDRDGNRLTALFTFETPEPVGADMGIVDAGVLRHLADTLRKAVRPGIDRTATYDPRALGELSRSEAGILQVPYADAEVVAAMHEIDVTIFVVDREFEMRVAARKFGDQWPQVHDAERHRRGHAQVAAQ